MATLLFADGGTAVVKDFEQFIRTGQFKNFVKTYGKVSNNTHIENETIEAIVRKYSLKPMGNGFYATVENNDEEDLTGGGCCPECGSPIHRQEGCMTCHSCGYSKCS